MKKAIPYPFSSKESKDANKLIEEFMLLANKTVAAEIGIAPAKKKARLSFIASTIPPTPTGWQICSARPDIRLLQA